MLPRGRGCSGECRPAEASSQALVPLWSSDAEPTCARPFHRTVFRIIERFSSTEDGVTAAGERVGGRARPNSPHIAPPRPRARTLLRANADANAAAHRPPGRAFSYLLKGIFW